MKLGERKIFASEGPDLVHRHATDFRGASLAVGTHLIGTGSEPGRNLGADTGAGRQALLEGIGRRVHLRDGGHRVNLQDAAHLVHPQDAGHQALENVVAHDRIRHHHPEAGEAEGLDQGPGLRGVRPDHRRVIESRGTAPTMR